MSALGHKRTSAKSFDYLVGACEQCRRHGYAQRIGGLQVDYKLELGRLFHWDIRAETGAASLIVHHPGWSGEHGRGHSSQFGAVDTDLFVAGGIMAVKKLRDGESGGEIAFRLKPTTVGFTNDGDRITSCYVEAGKKGEMQIELTGAEHETYSAIQEHAKPGEQFDTKTVVQWVQASNKNGIGRSVKKKTIWHHVQCVQKKGWIKKVADGQWVIEASNASNDVQDLEG
jgi:hypothetical protein